MPARPVVGGDSEHVVREYETRLQRYFLQFPVSLFNVVLETGIQRSGRLRESGWPDNLDRFGPPSIVQAEVHLLGVLRQVSRPRRDPLDLSVHLDARANRIAIRFRPAQSEYDAVSFTRALVCEHTHLRSQTALQNEIERAVPGEIGNRECASIVSHIESAHSGIVAISAIPPYEKDIGLVTIPAISFPDELVQCVPAALVCHGGFRFDGRLRHHLTPEETHQVRLDAVGQHATRNENLRRAVAIEIMRIR